MVAMWNWGPKQAFGITDSQTYTLVGVSMERKKAIGDAKTNKPQF